MRRHKLRTIWNNLIFFVCCMLVVNCSDGDDNGGGDTPHEGNINANNVLTEQHTASISDAEALKIAKRLEVPKLKGAGNYFIIHKANGIGVNFVTEWDMSKKSQRWSAYTMYYFSDSNNNISRKGVYRYNGDPQYPMDKDMPEEYYWTQDYFWGSGFDHGHVVPSADRLYSDIVNYQTFYLTNMQPMSNNFNCGVWGNMENLLRTWVKFRAGGNKFADTLYVVKGGTIDAEVQILKRISGKLIVPKYYYMAVLCKNSKTGAENNYGYKAMAFWVEHKDGQSSGDLSRYAISISELEQKTGIDFFCNLPDNVENAAESTYSKRAWNW